MAQKEMRDLSMLFSSKHAELAQSHRERLVIELGEIVTVDEVREALEAERDEQGFTELKELAALM